MIGERTDFTITATVQTPLHIGTGSDGDVDGIGKDGEKVRVALVQVDVDGYPMIPGSGIKGVLARHLDADLTLFGGKKPGKDMLESGKVIFWAAEMERDSVQVFGPHNNMTIPKTNYKHADKSLFIEVNTAIDPESGVVMAGRLFHKQMVAPGTRFKLSFSADTKKDDGNLAELFAVLCDDTGVSFGKGTKSSLGRLTVDLATFDAKTLGSDGTYKDTSEHWRKQIAGQTPTERQSFGCLKLTSDGPFLIADPSVLRESGDTSTPQISRRRNHLNQPLLTGTTLLGALRAGFADWLAKTQGNGKDDKDHVCNDIKEVSELTPSERIFGVTGWKGLLVVRGIASTGANERQEITSVRLDRFSNAPIDNALFTTEVWVAPSFEVTLEFDQNRASEDDQQQLIDFLTSLKDPIWGGLQLGQGVNKGFGWFTAEFERSAT